MSEHKCLRCGRILSNPKSIKLGYGKKCYRIIQLNTTEKPEIPNNTIMEELLNRVRKLELDNNFMKHQLKHKTFVNISKDSELDWDIPKEVKEIRDESKIQFNFVVKELNVIFESNEPALKKDFRYNDEELGIKPLIVEESLKRVTLKPIDPIDHPVSPPIIEVIA